MLGIRSKQEPRFKTRRLEVDGIFGPLVVGASGWWIWFRLPQFWGYDLMSPASKAAVGRFEANLYQSIVGHSGHLLGVPFRPDAQMWLENEADQALSLDPTVQAQWRECQQSEANRMREASLTTPMVYLGVQLKTQVNSRPNGEEPFGIERFWLGPTDHANLMEEAEAIRSSFGTEQVAPVTGVELARLLQQATNWGQPELPSIVFPEGRPIQRQGQLAWLGEQRVWDKNYEVVIDHLGTLSYATALPLRDLPLGRLDGSFPFLCQGDQDGRYLPVSVRFEVKPAEEARVDASNAGAEIRHYQHDTHVYAGQASEEYAEKAAINQALQRHVGERLQGTVVYGRGTVIVADVNLAAMRQKRDWAMRHFARHGITVGPPKDGVEDLLLECIPGSRLMDDGSPVRRRQPSYQFRVPPGYCSTGAALRMPRVGSAGGRLLGYTSGSPNEGHLRLPVYYSHESAPGNGGNIGMLLLGPLGVSKTTQMVEQVLGASKRGVNAIFMDPKGDTAGSFEQQVDFTEAGMLSPIMFGTNLQERVTLAFQFLRGCYREWNPDWKPFILASCQYVVQKRGEAASLFEVVQHLINQSQPLAHAAGMALYDIASDPAASVTFGPGWGLDRLRQRIGSGASFWCMSGLGELPQKSQAPASLSERERLLILSWKQAASAIKRLAALNHAEHRPTMVAMDEFHLVNALDGDNGLADWYLINGRSKDVTLVIGLQNWSGIGDFYKLMSSYMLYKPSSIEEARLSVERMNLPPSAVDKLWSLDASRYEALFRDHLGRWARIQLVQTYTKDFNTNPEIARQRAQLKGATHVLGTA